MKLNSHRFVLQRFCRSDKVVHLNNVQKCTSLCCEVKGRPPEWSILANIYSIIESVDSISRDGLDAP